MPDRVRVRKIVRPAHGGPWTQGWRAVGLRVNGARVTYRVRGRLFRHARKGRARL